jgi:hypothetical protein
MRLSLAAVLIAAASFAPPSVVAVEVLTPTSALPAHLAGQFGEPIGFVQATTGEYLVLDRRAHTVYRVDAKQTTVTQVLQIGFEEGRVLEPGVLAVSRDDIFAVADAPNGLERIQYFDLKGLFLGGFYLQGRQAPRISVGSLVLNGVGSMHFTGRTFLANRPDTGALISEFDLQGRELRRMGLLRATGHEADTALHRALNTGMPLADPAGGFFFVFQTGVPAFRKYDAAGTLIYERHIEGVELDAQIQRLPTEWPAQTGPGGTLRPMVEPLVRTAAIDPSGKLWISLTAPYTYVYSAAGDKVRTVQFRGAGIVSPTSLSFGRNESVLVTPGCYEFSAK